MGMTARNWHPGGIVSRAMEAPRRLPARPGPLAAVLAILALAGVVVGCTPGSGGAALPGVGPLVTVQIRGGLCPEGTCDSTVVLENDGRVHSADKPPNNLGLVPAPAMSNLVAAIQATDWTALKSKPFTGECPVAFDGQEQIFEFAVGTGTQRIASCEVEIDWSHPLFIAVANALGEWIQIPLF